MNRIAILASGTGSNAKKIHEKTLRESNSKVVCVISNRKKAKVLEYARLHNIEAKHFKKEEFQKGESVVEYLKSLDINLIVLAGFLLLIPKKLITSFPDRIINIHPALLPKYGGKGMYGKHVHLAVKESGDSASGITIHYVNENYDEGNIILQTKVKLSKRDDANDIANKVLKLEHHFYPLVISGLDK